MDISRRLHLMGRTSRRSMPTPFPKVLGTIGGHHILGDGQSAQCSYLLWHPLPTGLGLPRSFQGSVQGKGLDMSQCHSWVHGHGTQGLGAAPRGEADAIRAVPWLELCWDSSLTPQGPAPTATSPRNPSASLRPAPHRPPAYPPPVLLLRTGAQLERAAGKDGRRQDVPTRPSAATVTAVTDPLHSPGKYTGY